MYRAVTHKVTLAILASALLLPAQTYSTGQSVWPHSIGTAQAESTRARESFIGNQYKLGFARASEGE